MCSCMNTGWKGAAADLPFTIEKCMARCKGAGFRYAGIKGTNDAKSCWCGSGISDDEKLTTTAKCDVNCLTEAGDKTKGYDTKNCGGLTTWSVYKDPCYKDFDGDAEADNYEPIGCFYYWGGGILTTTIAEVNGDNLSTESCLQACASRGYAYAGTSASALSATWNRGDQCWCGGRVSAYWIQRHKDYPADNTQCTVLCSASEKIKASIQPSDYEYCGNAWYMNIYFNTNLEVSDTCDAGPPPSTTTATRKNKTKTKGTHNTSTDDTDTSTDDTDTSTPGVKSTTTKPSTPRTTPATTTDDTDTSTTDSPTTPTPTDDIETSTTDTPPEETSDTPPDATSDTPPDATSDTPPDETSDTPPDETSDTPPDATSDTPPDETSDTPPDATSDVPPAETSTPPDTICQMPQVPKGDKTKWKGITYPLGGVGWPSVNCHHDKTKFKQGYHFELYANPDAQCRRDYKQTTTEIQAACWNACIEQSKVCITKYASKKVCKGKMCWQTTVLKQQCTSQLQACKDANKASSSVIVNANKNLCKKWGKPGGGGPKNTGGGYYK
ncbi:hypothetical protein ABW20_dc0100282 [Dactylellina cionopaga]|nr:hypothetical protein ABW20_dc0100282 [Dactylellina cionopaga]